MSVPGDRFFEAETLRGRWLFTEIELCFFGEPARQFTVACPFEVDEDEVDERIEDAMDKCFRVREGLVDTHATAFDAGEILRSELEAHGLHVLPSVQEAMDSAQPSHRLQ